MLNIDSSSLWVYFLASLEHNEGHRLNVNTETKSGALHGKIVLQYEPTFAAKQISVVHFTLIPLNDLFL